VGAFRRMREADRFATGNLDHYSTALWYLQRPVELSTLAREALAVDRHAPEAWCAAGNCLSLRRDHGRALGYFRRALQLDPRSAYAHTLCGHELGAQEDLEGALRSYRSALALQPRHHNAWYGMSQVFARQEKWDLAEYHLQRAMQVHPTSAVLKCHCAIAMARSGRLHQALAVVQEAIRLDPGNPLARYERASMLLDMSRPKEALEELLALRDLAPREAPVHALLGRVYRQLGHADRALRSLAAALALSPPDADASGVKAALERVHQPEDTQGDEL